MTPKILGFRKDAPEPASKESKLAWRLTKLRVVLLLLLLLAIGGTAHLAVIAAEASERESRRQKAVEAAEVATVAVLSYDFGRFDEGVKTATQLLTPDFAREFREYSTSTVKPMAKKYRAIITTETIASGVERVEGNDATVLLYLDQTTRSSQLVAPRVDSSTVTAQLKWADGKWLLASLEPI